MSITVSAARERRLPAGVCDKEGREGWAVRRAFSYPSAEGEVFRAWAGGLGAHLVLCAMDYGEFASNLVRPRVVSSLFVVTPVWGERWMCRVSARVHRKQGPLFHRCGHGEASW